MKKQDKIQDSPEFQHYKDDFENFKKRMEEDKESAELKMPDLNAANVEAACSMIAGTARSMGVEVVD